MKIDFHGTTEWADLNDRLASQLEINDSSCEVRAYRGISHALNETLLGLAKLYPLKKKVFYFQNMDTVYAGALTLLAKDGYQLVGLNLLDLQDPQKIVTLLDKEALALIYSVDDALLGRAFPVQSLEGLLGNISTQKIRLSHAAHFFSSVNKNPDKNSTFLYSLTVDKAVAIAGERARVGSISAAVQDWAPDWDLSTFLTSISEESAKIKKFEATEIAGAKPFFQANELRILDRTVIFWLDMDGYAFIDRLAQHMGMTLLPAGQEMRMETTSLTRWGGVRTMDWMKAMGVSPEIIRGLVIFSADLLNTEFEKKLVKVRQEVLQDQNGGQ